MSSCGSASHPLWGRSSEKGCISNSERGNLSNSSCPMPTGEDGHTGGNAAGVCLTGTKPPSMRVVNAELENLVFGPRKEFITMAILVLINIPLVRFINKDW